MRQCRSRYPYRRCCVLAVPANRAPCRLRHFHGVAQCGVTTGNQSRWWMPKCRGISDASSTLTSMLVPAPICDRLVSCGAQFGWPASLFAEWRWTASATFGLRYWSRQNFSRTDFFSRLLYSDGLLWYLNESTVVGPLIIHCCFCWWLLMVCNKSFHGALYGLCPVWCRFSGQLLSVSLCSDKPPIRWCVPDCCGSHTASRCV